MLKLKEQTTATREELAGLLFRLADQLAGGKISIKKNEIKIPKKLEVKYKYKNDDGYSKFKFSFKWNNNSADSSPEIQLDVLKPQASYKELKKQLRDTLNAANLQISNGSILTDWEAQNLIDIIDASIKQSKPELLLGMEHLKQVAYDLKKAVADNSIEDARRIISFLYRQKEKYHDQYK
ncbi:MAG: amphi-Trp domain-containing protein [bacterium]|nr:amphi-Trp domain-containing protein [bacterium]